MNYKKDFPIFGTNQKANPLIYLDSAATAQKPGMVIDAVNDFYTAYNANIHRGIYGIAEKATAKVEETREKVAAFIGADHPSEIIFTHGTTEGLNLLAHSSMQALTKKKGALLSQVEHHSNIVPWQYYAASKKSFISYFAVNEDGRLDGRIIDAYGSVTENDLNKYSVISVAHASNVLGSINDVGKISERIKGENSNAILIVDAAQSIPHMKVDVKQLGADFIVFSGHKMFSPTGVGILWGKKKLLNTLRPLLYGSQMIEEVNVTKSTYANPPEKFEPGTLPLEGIIGLGAAIDYINKIGMDTIYTHEQELAAFALRKLSEVKGLQLLGPKRVENRIGVFSFNLEEIHPHDVAQVLATRNICVRAGHHCAMPLHKALAIPASVRVSLQVYNTEEDIIGLVSGLNECKKIFSVR